MKPPRGDNRSLNVLIGGCMTEYTQKFGSFLSTGKKLDIIELYLKLYQKTVKATGYFDTIYVDAFAGTGEIQLYDDIDTELENLFIPDDWVADNIAVDQFLAGSTERALNVEPYFDKYIFIEKDASKISDLESRYTSHDAAQRIRYEHGDANEQVIKFCRETQWSGKWGSRGKRAVMFLDPFGSQVRWETIEEIAKTQAIDLWYLFPAGVSVYRQVGNDGSIHSTHEPSITRIFGTEDWKKAFLKPVEKQDLFDPEPRIVMEKTVTPLSATEFMMDRMRDIFKGGVLDIKIPLGKHSYPSFYLIFAWGNPSPAARTLANNLSRAAINSVGK